VNVDAQDGGTGTNPVADARVVGADANGKICPTQRVIGLDTSAEVPYSELPGVIAGFLTSFLSVDYIKEHFRFFTRDDSSPPAKTVLYIHMTYGPQNVGGTIA
jgi:hypothetical protein